MGRRQEQTIIIRASTSAGLRLRNIHAWVSTNRIHLDGVPTTASDDAKSVSFS